VPRPDLSHLDPGGVLERAVGLERVVGCMVNSANAIAEPGVIRNSPGTRNRFTLGEPDGTQAFARTAGIATPHLDAITALVIEKARRMGLYPPAVW
jgi:hypothetical protein